MSTPERIESILRNRFRPTHFELTDDSALHAGHPGAASGGGHYTVLIVADAFEGRTLLEQHRMVHDALRDLIGGEIHALALKTIPPSQWRS
jgi:BolA protein